MVSTTVFVPEGYKVVVQKQRKKPEIGDKKMGKESKLEKIYDENPELLSHRQIYKMKWRQANREKINEYALNYYHKHKNPELISH